MLTSLTDRACNICRNISTETHLIHDTFLRAQCNSKDVDNIFVVLVEYVI